MATTAQNSISAFFWWQISYIGIICIPVLFMHFVYVFLEIKRVLLLKIVYLITLPIFLSNIFLEKIFVGNVSLLFTDSKWFTPAWWVYPPGPLLVFHTLFLYVGLLVYVFVMLIKAYKHSPPNKRTQIKYFTIATITGFVGGGTSYLPSFGIEIYPVLNIAVPLYVLLITYTIIYHRLMDIRVAIKRTLIYSILISVITIAYIVTALFIEHLFKGIVGYSSLPISIFMIILLVIVFQPLKNYIQRVIDKYFFHGSIDEINAENIKLRGEIQKTEKLKAVATLAASMAHEIKNPLTGIKTFTEYLPQKHNNPEFMQKFQKIVGMEVDKINNIVKQLLEFAKPSELNIKSTDISNLLDETSDLLNSDFLKSNIKLTKNYIPFPKIQIDPVQMKQVFLNLLLNAKDSMPEGGMIRIKTQKKQSGQISVKISDTGKGIDKEDLKHIFNPFFTKKAVGTGLGLNVVHGIVTKHDGSINVESAIGKGTTVEIMLPHPSFTSWE